jgi:hypothetical protein
MPKVVRAGLFDLLPKIKEFYEKSAPMCNPAQGTSAIVENNLG